MIKAPAEFDGSFADALGRAESKHEPVFVPLRHHCDDRGWSLMNLLTGVLGPAGQINYSLQHPGVVKAWHRHDHQTDCWICVSGHVKAGVHRESDGASWSTVLGEARPGVLFIPPPLWHGAATIGAEPAALLYYVTRAYDAKKPDEIRRPWDSVPGFSWTVEHR